MDVDQAPPPRSASDVQRDVTYAMSLLTTMQTPLPSSTTWPELRGISELLQSANFALGAAHKPSPSASLSGLSSLSLSSSAVSLHSSSATPSSSLSLPSLSSSSSSSATRDPYSVQLRQPTAAEWTGPLGQNICAALAAEISRCVDTEPSPLHDPPELLSANFVAELLSPVKLNHPTCDLQDSCYGLQLLQNPHIRRAYTSRAEWLNFLVTGELPVLKARLCYLCMLNIENTVYELVAQAKTPLKQLVPPFVHLKDVPGGYTAAAFCAKDAPGLVHPVREFRLSDYVQNQAAGGCTDRPELLCAPIRPWLPECYEDVLEPEIMLRAAAPKTVPLKAGPLLKFWPVCGSTVPPTSFLYYADEEWLRRSLAFCPLYVGLLRLDYALQIHGDAILQRAALLPSRFLHWRDAAPFPETLKWVRAHMVHTLLRIKMEECAALVHRGGLAPMLRQKLAALTDAIAPLLSAVSAAEGLEDMELLSTNEQRWCLYAKHFPFVVTQFAVAASVPCKTSSGLLLSPTLYFAGAFPVDLLPVVKVEEDAAAVALSLFARAKRNIRLLCQSSLWPTMRWLSCQDDLGQLAALPVLEAGLTTLLGIGQRSTMIWNALVLRAALLTDVLAHCRTAAETRSFALSTQLVDLFEEATSARIDIEQDIARRVARGKQPTHTSARARTIFASYLRSHVRIMSRLAASCASADDSAERLLPGFFVNWSSSELFAVYDARSDLAAILPLAEPAHVIHEKALGAAVQKLLADEQGKTLLRKLLQASMLGLYPHCRVVPSVMLMLLLYKNAADPPFDLPACMHAVREYCLAMLLNSPRGLAVLASRYTNVDGWMQAVIDAGDALRSNRALDAWPPASARVMRKEYQDFGRLQRMCSAVDAKIIAASAIASGRLQRQQCAAQTAIVEKIARYATCLPLHRPFDLRWTRPLGVRRACKALLRAAMGPLGAQQILVELAAFSPLVYACVSVFVQMYALALTRTRSPLDAATATRQLRAVLLDSGSYIAMTHACALSNMLCCNRICDILRQSHPEHTGRNGTRMSMEEHLLTCEDPRYRTSPEQRASYATVRNALQNAPAADKTRRLIEQWASAAQKTSQRSECGRPIELVCVVGAVVRVGDASSCTLCPNCGHKTAFSLAFFGPNGFSCGVCEPKAAVAAVPKRGLTMSQKLRRTRHCVLCKTKVIDGNELVRTWLIACPLLDDESFGVACPRPDAMCCNLCAQDRPWLKTMASTMMPLSELRHYAKHKFESGTCVEEMLVFAADAAMVSALRTTAMFPLTTNWPLYRPEMLQLTTSVAQKRGAPAAQPPRRRSAPRRSNGVRPSEKGEEGKRALAEEETEEDEAEEEKKPMLQRQMPRKANENLNALCDDLIAQLRKENAQYIADKHEAKRQRRAQANE